MAMQWTGEAEPGHPLWWDALADTPGEGALPERCDLLVIGAGYAGLSAAIAAHDCGARVVVVDAGEPGKGASTRNGGMFGAHPRLGWEALAARYGASTADAVFAEATPALTWAKNLIAAEGIDCDLQQTGRIILAWSRSHFEAQKRLADELAAKTDVAFRLLGREELGGEIATECYFGGLVLAEHCGLHPAKFHHGLLGAARRRGIPVVGHAAVHACDRDGAGHAAATARGTIRAGKVVLATNGYTTRPFRWHLRRVFPVPSYIIATEELPDETLNALAPGRRMMVETRMRHSYYRVSPDGRRILFGGRASLVGVDLATAAARLRRTLCEIWPALAEVRLSHVWTGYTGFSFSFMPAVGGADGLHHAMGFSGSGTVMAPYLGAKAAYQALGDARGETAY